MRNSATAKMAPFLMVASSPRPLFGNGRAILRVGHQDLHFLEPREIHGRFGLHLLVDAEDALDDVGNLGNRYAFRKAATVTARDEHVSLLDLVGPLDVFDSHDVA